MVTVVAQEYRITLNTIRILVAKAKRKPKMLEELLSMQHLKQRKTELIEKVVDELVIKDAFIDSCDFVLKEVNK